MGGYMIHHASQTEAAAYSSAAGRGYYRQMDGLAWCGQLVLRNIACT